MLFHTLKFGASLLFSQGERGESSERSKDKSDQKVI